MISPCTHDVTGDATRACSHLLGVSSQGYCLRFTGHGLRFDYVCEACAHEGTTLAPSRFAALCPECVRALRDEDYCVGIVGEPEILTRASELRFEHRMVRLSGLPAGPLLDLQPVDALSRSEWIALSSDYRLWRLDLTEERCDALGALPPSSLDLSMPLSLIVDREGRFGAVINTTGRYGLVLDLKSGRPTMGLDRGDYHNEHCRFSAAFFTPEGADPLLVHASRWNRLEISDPRTGQLRTRRDAMEYRSGGPPPTHYLDYFHCGLAVSPNGTWIADNGWVWHPVGTVRTWSLESWLHENTFESEDGASLRYLCWRDYHWDGPLYWVDERTLAIAGYGDDDAWLLKAAVRVFDVVSGEELRWFAGPRGELHFDNYLFASSVDAGTTVWDVTTGECLLHAPDLHPKDYHRGAREFCTPLPASGFLLSRLAPMEPLHDAKV